MSTRGSDIWMCAVSRVTRNTFDNTLISQWKNKFDGLEQPSVEIYRHAESHMHKVMKKAKKLTLDNPMTLVGEDYNLHCLLCCQDDDAASPFFLISIVSSIDFKNSRQVGNILSDMKTELLEIQNIETDNFGDFNKKASSIFPSVIKSQKLTKLEEIGVSIERNKEEVKKALNKEMENLEIAEHLALQSDILIKKGEMFRKRTRNLEISMKCRNIKLCVLVALVFLCVVGYIVAPHIDKAISGTNNVIQDLRTI